MGREGGREGGRERELGLLIVHYMISPLNGVTATSCTIVDKHFPFLTPVTWPSVASMFRCRRHDGESS